MYIERITEIRQQQKILELYYDMAEIDDRDPMTFNFDNIKTRLNKFFQDTLNKTL